MPLSSTSLPRNQHTLITKTLQDLQDEGGVWWDETGVATGTVGVVTSDGKSGLLAERHTTISAEDTLIPA